MCLYITYLKQNHLQVFPLRLPVHESDSSYSIYAPFLPRSRTYIQFNSFPVAASSRILVAVAIITNFIIGLISHQRFDCRKLTFIVCSIVTTFKAKLYRPESVLFNPVATTWTNPSLENPLTAKNANDDVLIIFSLYFTQSNQSDAKTRTFHFPRFFRCSTFRKLPVSTRTTQSVGPSRTDMTKQNKAPEQESRHELFV